jgi:hypothetical protein
MYLSRRKIMKEVLKADIATYKKMPHFSMAMPDWFIELPIDEQKRIIDRLKKPSSNFREGTVGELKGLLVPSRV